LYSPLSPLSPCPQLHPYQVNQEELTASSAVSACANSSAGSLKRSKGSTPLSSPPPTEDSLHNNHITIIPFLARENASDDLLFGEPPLVRHNEMINDH